MDLRQSNHIPVELLRAFVVVAESKSFATAAGSLNLTESTISAQLKRLRDLLGGNLFENDHSLRLTRWGMHLLNHARRIVGMNDELLALAGRSSRPAQLAVGLPAWMDERVLANVFTRCVSGPSGERVGFRCNHTEVLIKELENKTLDVAFLCNTGAMPRTPGTQFSHWSEQLYWIKSPRLALPPGAPIPLISLTGTNPERVALKALQDCNMPFYIAFSGPDWSARRAAVAGGLGVLATIGRLITPDVEIVRDALPDLPAVETGLFVRDGLDLRRFAPLLNRLSDALDPRGWSKPKPTGFVGKTGFTGKKRPALI